MLFRRKQFMGQLPVVRNEKKSLRINIQPAYGKQILSLCISNQGDHSRMQVVLRRRNHALRLIQHEIFHPGIGNRLSVHADAGNLRIEFEIGAAADCTVHGDPSFPNRLLYLASGSLLHLGQKLVKPYHSRHHCHLHPG